VAPSLLRTVRAATVRVCSDCGTSSTFVLSFLARTLGAASDRVDVCSLGLGLLSEVRRGNRLAAQATLQRELAKRTEGSDQNTPKMDIFPYTVESRHTTVIHNDPMTRANWSFL